MYILASTILAALTHKKLKINFVILAFAMMLVNLVDIDHIITYNFAIGGANPFKIFILHRFWSFLCLIVLLIALILKDWQNIIFGIGLALGLHFVLDLAIFSLHIEQNFFYDALIQAALLILFLVITQTKLIQIPIPLKIFWYLLIITIAIDFILYLIQFKINLLPHISLTFYLTSSILTLVAALGFYFGFRKEYLK
jgi:hypothetical protein